MVHGGRVSPEGGFELAVVNDVRLFELVHQFPEFFHSRVEEAQEPDDGLAAWLDFGRIARCRVHLVHKPASGDRLGVGDMPGPAQGSIVFVQDDQISETLLGSRAGGGWFSVLHTQQWEHRIHHIGQSGMETGPTTLR